MFAAAGWQVITVKFGTLLEELFGRPGGAELRPRIVDMPNPEYQRLLRCSADELRARLPAEGYDAGAIGDLIAELDDDTLVRAIGNLGGHDMNRCGRRSRRSMTPGRRSSSPTPSRAMDCRRRDIRRTTRRC